MSNMWYSDCSMDKFLRFLQTTMEEPKAGGAMHLTAIIAVIVLTALLCIFFRNADEKTFRVILISIWSVMFLMEVLKQVSISCIFAEDGTKTWHYDWGQFTLQLCDTPIYLLLPVAFVKNGKFRNALSTYMATYILLGGIATYAFPASIYSISVYHNVHTLVHHGLQIASCLFIGIHNRKNLHLKSFLWAIVIFIISVGIATVYNVVMHKLHPDQFINMFFISPYFVKDVPEVVNAAWHKMHWMGRIGLYIGGVTVLAFIIFLFYQLVCLRWRKDRTEPSQTAEVA